MRTDPLRGCEKVANCEVFVMLSRNENLLRNILGESIAGYIISWGIVSKMFSDLSELSGDITFND